MAFFLSTKGQLHPYTFKYLQGEFESARLERTQIHSNTSKDHFPKEKVDFFAIDVMSRPIFSLPSETLLKDIYVEMQKRQIRHIPMMKEHIIVGIVSDRDLLKVDQTGTFLFLKGSDIMTTILVVAEEETPLAHIARVLIEEKISALPIINKKDELTGIISRTDILKTVVYNRLVLK